MIRAVTSVLLGRKIDGVNHLSLPYRMDHGQPRLALLVPRLLRTPTTMFQDRMDVDVGSLMKYSQARFTCKVW